MQKSELSALSNNRTAVIEARVDIRILARLAELLSELQTPARSKSELVRQALSLLVEILVENKRILPPEALSTGDALSRLSQLGLGSVNRSGRNFRVLAKAIELEDTAGIVISDEPFALSEELRKAILAEDKRIQEILKE